MDISEVDWSGEFDGETFELPVNNSYVVGCHWHSEGETKYVIIFLHGLNNCVSFNCNFLREIPKHGGSAIASDHIGSGKSPGVNQYTSIEEICEETRQLIRYARVIYGPDVPIFLMGHSLGGLTVLNFCLSHVTEVNMLSGVIAHAPWLDTGKALRPTPFLVSVVRLAAAIVPRFQIPTGLKIENSCYPEAYKRMAISSGFAKMSMTPFLFNSVLSSMKFVKENRHLFPTGLPLLFIQGTDDGCVNVENNIEWAEEVIEKQGEDTKSELKIIEGGPHDTTKYKTRKESLTTLFEFIRKVCK